MAAPSPQGPPPAAASGPATGINQELSEVAAFICSGAFFVLLQQTDLMSRTEKEFFFEDLSDEDLSRRGIDPPPGISIEICAGPHRDHVAPDRPVFLRVHKELPDGVHKLTVAFDHHEGHSWLPRSGV